ncbi:MAG: hypothetical protein JSS81_06115 [Acidobacteria bacterium]|nr:hypothetical protein [Acidobacteriota bacterium]
MLVLGLLTITFSFNPPAVAQTKGSFQPSIRKRFVSDVRLGDFRAETFAGVTRLRWKTDFEQNVLGFRLWRQDQGQLKPVSADLVGGSMMKVANGLLPDGGEYAAYDQTDSTNVYYWLEVVDINTKSGWFGPFYPQPNFSAETAAAVSDTVAKIDEAESRRKVQTDQVNFSTPRISKAKVRQMTPPAAGLLADNGAALKIEVRSRGIYRIDAQSLADNGFLRTESAYWKVFAGGVEQPITVNTDGSLDFFGVPVDTLQTTTNIYWLVLDKTPGLRFSQRTQPFIDSAVYGWSPVTAERRDKTYRVSSVLNGPRENWFGAVVNGTASNQTLTLSDIATDSGQTATLGIDLQGLTSIAHQVSVVLNGVSIGQINYYNLQRTEWQTTVPLSNLVEGTNTITLKGLNTTSDISITEAVRIIYPRRLKALNDRLDFSVPAGQSVKLKGFASAQVRILDITDPTQIVEYQPASAAEGDGTYSVTVAAASSARVMLAQGGQYLPFAATPLIRNNPSYLKNVMNGARFVVITTADFRKSIHDFCELRQLRGMSTMLVDVQDIYDEFNHGVKSPEAIHDFLQYAKTNWAVKPEFALFAGDGTNDPKNYTGLAGDNYNRIPTMMTDTWNLEVASDEMMADFDNDSVGEIALGRLPAKDEVELEWMIEKTILAEPLTRQEVGERGVFFVADANTDYDFPSGSRYIGLGLPASIPINYLDRTTQDPQVLRTAIIDGINARPAVVNYFGHATVTAWSGALIFRVADAASLVNTKKTPFMTMIDCANGDFAEAGIDSLAEAVLKQRYGANAVWASSGWNTAYEQELMTNDFYKKVFTGMPLGEAARQTKLMYGGNDLRRTYIFFGDPTQPLVIP